VRTIPQHAWAEIEHDLGYKSAASVPAAIRRRFSRLASLLELADEEFLAIRRQLEDYASQVRRQQPEDFRRLPVDGVSLQAFVHTPAVASLDAQIAQSLSLPLAESLFYPDYLIRMLTQVGLTHLEALERELATRQEELLAFVPHYFGFAQEAWRMSSEGLERVFRGYSLVFLSHLVLLTSSALELDRAGRVADFFAQLDYAGDQVAARRVAVRLLEAYKAYQQAAPARVG
jgi:putative GTP pyrophosphokinase